MCRWHFTQHGWYCWNIYFLNLGVFLKFADGSPHLGSKREAAIAEFPHTLHGSLASAWRKMWVPMWGRSSSDQKNMPSAPLFSSAVSSLNENNKEQALVRFYQCLLILQLMKLATCVNYYPDFFPQGIMLREHKAHFLILLCCLARWFLAPLPTASLQNEMYHHCWFVMFPFS